MNHYQSTDPDHSLFDTLISPFYEDIKKYCISLATSSWEAEDLLQDTLMKSYIALKKILRDLYPSDSSIKLPNIH